MAKSKYVAGGATSLAAKNGHKAVVKAEAAAADERRRPGLQGNIKSDSAPMSGSKQRALGGSKTAAGRKTASNRTPKVENTKLRSRSRHKRGTTVW